MTFNDYYTLASAIAFSVLAGLLRHEGYANLTMKVVCTAMAVWSAAMWLVK